MTLIACASASKPTPASGPALKTTVQRELICPAEVDLELPARADPAKGAELRANPEADAYLDAKDQREDLLEARLRDAQAECRHRYLGRQ